MNMDLNNPTNLAILFYKKKLAEFQPGCVIKHKEVMPYSNFREELVANEVREGTALHDVLSTAMDLNSWEQEAYMQVLVMNLLYYLVEWKEGSIDDQAFSRGLVILSTWIDSKTDLKWGGFVRHIGGWLHTGDGEHLLLCSKVTPHNLIEDNGDEDEDEVESPPTRDNRIPSPDRKPATRKRRNVDSPTSSLTDSPHDSPHDSPVLHHRKKRVKRCIQEASDTTMKANYKQNGMNCSYEGTSDSVLKAKKLDNEIMNKQLDNEVASKELDNENKKIDADREIENKKLDNENKKIDADRDIENKKLDNENKKIDADLERKRLENKDAENKRAHDLQIALLNAQSPMRQPMQQPPMSPTVHPPTSPAMYGFSMQHPPISPAMYPSPMRQPPTPPVHSPATHRSQSLQPLMHPPAIQRYPLQPLAEHQVMSFSYHHHEYSAYPQPGQQDYQQYYQQHQAIPQPPNNIWAALEAGERYKTIATFSLSAGQIWPHVDEVSAALPRCTVVGHSVHNWQKFRPTEGKVDIECSCTMGSSAEEYHACLRMKIFGGIVKLQYDSENPNSYKHRNGMMAFDPALLHHY